MSKRKSTPKTQDCTVCGYPRKFVTMREKEGKDGRVARWPEYETCPRKGDPAYHITKSNILNALDDELRNGPALHAIKRVIKHKDRPTGLLFQVLNKESPLEEIAECLLEYERRTDGKLPVAIGVRSDESGEFTEITWEREDGTETDIPIWPANYLSPNYGYIYLIMAML